MSNAANAKLIYIDDDVYNVKICPRSIWPILVSKKVGVKDIQKGVVCIIEVKFQNVKCCFLKSLNLLRSTPTYFFLPILGLSSD